MKPFAWGMVLRVACAATAIGLLTLASHAQSYPPVPAPLGTSAYGQHIQRSMHLMASSTPEHRNTVKILHYGQSIVGQHWSEQVDADLRRRFPNTDFVTKNLAIGGFSSPRLVRTMHYDVFPFYPDLIIFHVYGSHTDYEDIIRAFRSKTTAEVVIQTDHANTWPEPKAESALAQEQWSDRMSFWYLPEYAERYGCALQPQRREWEQYLKTHGLEPEALLTDSVHLNDHGKWLMGELMKRFLVVLPDADESDWEDLVKTYEVGEDLHWENGTLTLEFEGNRVEALAQPGETGEIEVLVDGKAPSAYPECYSFTRPSVTGGVSWPAYMYATWDTMPVLEEWTATFSDFNEDHTDFAFSVAGSVTGPDGEGRGSERFVSNSGRLVIEPEDWVFPYSYEVGQRQGHDPTPEG